MAPAQSRQLLIWSVPTFAILLSFLWYKRRGGTRSDPGGVSSASIESTESLTAKQDLLVQSSEKASIVCSPKPVSPSRTFTRSLSGIDTAPIDIKTNKSPPVIISDMELDMEIEKIKSMKSVSNHMSAVPVVSGATIITSGQVGVSGSGTAYDEVHITRDSANHSPVDAMLASPSSYSLGSDGHHSDSDSGKGGSDVATPPPPQVSSSVEHETQPLLNAVHEFVIPQQLVGRLIGRHGAFVHQIKDKTNANILIKRHPESQKSKVCAVEGTQAEIDAALDMIRDKFPEKRYPDVTLDHVTFGPSAARTMSLVADCMHLKLVEGINNDTMVSCMVTPTHLFLQQPTHPTFPSLTVLSGYMNACYNTDTTDSPMLPDPIANNTICVAHSLGAWYRAIVVSSDAETATCCVKFLDYGGYATVDSTMLRQIRGDFLLLPFQAAECLLANVQPENEDEETWSQEAYDMVAELTKGAVVFTQVIDYLEDATPLVHIYVRGPKHVIFLNQELVRRGLAKWVESVA